MKTPEIPEGDGAEAARGRKEIGEGGVVPECIGGIEKNLGESLRDQGDPATMQVTGPKYRSGIGRQSIQQGLGNQCIPLQHHRRVC